MKLTIVEKNLLSWTAMHIDFVLCKKVQKYETTLDQFIRVFVFLHIEDLSLPMPLVYLFDEIGLVVFIKKETTI